MFSIGQMSRRTGVKIPTIRYYEGEGLIAPEGRSAGNQRRYDQAGLDRLTFIKHARDLGLGLEAIRALMGLDTRDAKDHADVHRIAGAHLADVQSRIRRLQRLEAELQRIQTSCDQRQTEGCAILQAFGDHDLCDAPH